MVKLTKPMRWSLEAPQKFLPVAPIYFCSSILPFLGFVVCIIYTIFFSQDELSQWHMPDCPSLQTSVPPLSYVIGVWEPQRLILLICFYIHMPARFIITYMYFPVFTWYPQTLGMYVATIFECIGLTFVIVLHVNLGFEFHAFWFGVWVIGFIACSILQVELHRLHDLGKKHKRLKHSLIIKWIIIISTIATFVSMSYTYPYATTRCSVFMYTIFVLTEYAIVFFYSLFYAIVLYEFNCEFSHYKITAIRHGEEHVKEKEISMSDSSATV